MRKICNDKDRAKADLGCKWQRLFRPFTEGCYPAELVSVPFGWLPLVDRICAELDIILPADTAPAFDRLQAKNGHLEAWWMFAPHAGSNLIEDIRNQVEEMLTRYEDESFTICGYCGDSAKEESGEHIPICDACHAKIGR